MLLKVIIDDGSDDAGLREKAEKIEGVDQSLRHSFSGFDLDTVMPEARTSLAQVDVDLDDDRLRAYAQSICDRTDFELVLR